MRFRKLGLILITGVLCGCHYRDPSIDMLHGELRWMEDQLYLLESELDDACVELARCKKSKTDCVVDCEPSAAVPWMPVTDPAPAGSGTRLFPFRKDNQAAPSPNDRPATGGTGRSTPTDVDVSSPVEVELPDAATDVPTFESPAAESTPSRRFEAPRSESSRSLEPPVPQEDAASSDRSEQLDLRPFDEPQPVPAIPNTGSPPRLESDDRPSFPDNNRDADLLEPNPIRLQSHWEPAADDAVGERSPALDAHVTHVVVAAQRHATDTHDHDLTVVIEPRNADGQYVALPAPVSVVVLDRSKSGAAARIARWDRTAEETATQVQITGAGRGLHLELSWPQTVPVSDELVLFARYTTIDGRKLEARVRLDADTPVPIADTEWVVDPVADTPSDTPSTGWTVVSHEEEPTDEQGLLEPLATEESWEVVPREPARLKFFPADPNGEARPRTQAAEPSVRQPPPLSALQRSGGLTPPTSQKHRPVPRPEWRPNR